MTARKPAKRKPAPRLTVLEGGMKDRTTRQIRKATKDYAAALREKPVEEVMCRGLKHSWTIYNKIRLYNPVTRRALPIMRVDLICERGMHAHPIRHETFVVKKVPGTKNEWLLVERLGRSYTYPDGYQMKGMVRGAKSADLTWQELLNREAAMIVYADEPAQQRKDRRA